MTEKEFRRPQPIARRRPASGTTVWLSKILGFWSPFPFPEPQRGPGLLVVDSNKEQYQIFRRYLFDWRTGLSGPLALLLNEPGHAVKIYAKTPSKQQVDADLHELARFSPRLGLPFTGDYINTPHRDFFKFGAAYLWAGYSEQALPYLEQVLQRTPENARVLVLVGRIHLEAIAWTKPRRGFAKRCE